MYIKFKKTICMIFSTLIKHIVLKISYKINLFYVDL